MTKRLRQKVKNYQPEELRDVVDHMDRVYEKLAKLADEWKIATNDKNPADENETDDLDFLN